MIALFRITITSLVTSHPVIQHRLKASGYATCKRVSHSTTLYWIYCYVL